MSSIPPEVVSLYISLLHEEADEVFANVKRFPNFFIRINTLKKPKLEVIRRLKEKGVTLSPLSWFQ